MHPVREGEGRGGERDKEQVEVLEGGSRRKGEEEGEER